jgi:hypothetical protein
MIAIRTLCAMLVLTGIAAAQDVIPLYQDMAPGSTQENYPEKQYFSKALEHRSGHQRDTADTNGVQTRRGVAKRHRYRNLPRRRFHGPLDH